MPTVFFAFYTLYNYFVESGIGYLQLDEKDREAWEGIFDDDNDDATAARGGTAEQGKFANPKGKDYVLQVLMDIVNTKLQLDKIVACINARIQAANRLNA